VTVYLYHEAHYREQLAELKEKRKEAKRELGTIKCCISESIYVHMEIPVDVDIENLYMVEMPEFEGNIVDNSVYEPYKNKTVEPLDAVNKVCDKARRMVEDAEEFTGQVIEEGMEEEYYPVSEPEMTKERYEALTDKEKVVWLGLAECSVQEAIHRFVSKLDSIGIVYKYGDDMLDEFMRLESVVRAVNQESVHGKDSEEEDRSLDKSRGRSR